MGVLANLGYIKQAAYYPCQHENPLLVIQAAGDALYPVLLGAISLGCNDIVKMRAGISPWHARGMRALTKFAITPQDGWGAGQLLKYTVPLEKLLFFWFVVDLSTEFLARWQSNIFKLGACGPAPLDCNYSGTNPSWIGTNINHWSAISYETANKTGACPGVGPIGFDVPAGWYWSAFFDMTPHSIFPSIPVGQVNMRLTRRSPFLFNYEPQVFKPKWYANKVSASYMAHGQNKHNSHAEYWWEAASDVPAFAGSGTAAVVLSEFPVYNKGIIPVNCFGAPAPTAENP